MAQMMFGEFRSAARRRRLVVSIGLLTAGGALAGASGCGFTSCEDTRDCDPEESEATGGAGGESPTNEGTGGSDLTEGGAGGEMSVGEECKSGELLCDEACVDPQTSVEYCGASGTCSGKSAGTACEAGQLCDAGECVADCGDGTIVCDGKCIDPLSDPAFCGAKDSCSGKMNVGTSCGDTEACVQGTCFSFTESKPLSTGRDGTPSALELGIDATGSAIVAWAQGATGDVSNIYVRHYDPVSEWTEMAEVDGRAWDASSPSLAVNAAGQAQLVWRQSLDVNPDQVNEVSYDPVTSLWSTRTTISGTVKPMTCANPFVTLDDDGNAFAGWEEVRNGRMAFGNNRLVGGGWGASDSLKHPDANPHAADDVFLSSLPEQEALAVWINADEKGVPAIWSETALANGTYLAPQSVSVPGGPSTSGLNVSGNGKGTVAAVWVAANRALVSVYSDAAWSDPEVLASPASQKALSAAVDVDPTGAVVVIWRETDSITQTLYGTRLLEAGGAWSEPEVVSSGSANVDTARVAVDGFGNATAVWISLDEGVPSVWASRRERNAAAWSAPFTLESSADPMRGPAIAFNDAGQGIVLWWEDRLNDRIAYSLFH